MRLNRLEHSSPAIEAMGLAAWFQTFCTAIQVQDIGTISRRYKNITKRLNTDFWDTTSETAHSLYVGSYGRNTATQGFSDLDMIFRLPVALYHRYNGHLGNGQSALLQQVRSSMKKTYSTSHVGADGQVIAVSFQDGITFEVVPAFLNTDDSFTFPNANGGGSWKTTDPKPEIAAIRSRNLACNGNLIRLCRMLRSWKNEWNVPIAGLLIDTLAYQFMEDYGYRGQSFLYYDFMCRDFFEWASERDSDQAYWRAPGSAQYVHRQGLFQYKAKRCYNISLEAIDHEQAGREWSAKKRWRDIFGTCFPS